jgi:NTE family protein
MTARNIVAIDLALQGGGSHGAFTWGVLDRLLEEDRIHIEAVSGTSAGAMNACALVEGLARGGPEAARVQLRAYWTAVARAGQFSPVQRSPLDRMMGRWSLEFSPSFHFYRNVLSRISPYVLNPFSVNPLRDVVRDVFDFEVINDSAAKLFIAATNVRTGRRKVFRQPDISAESVLASACLPYLSHAVEIDGDAYWDGGFMGNPPLFPLVDETEARDLMIIWINPFERPELPLTSFEIEDRLNEIVFNGSLIEELRALGFIAEIIREENLEREAYRTTNLHCIDAEDEMRQLGASSKLNAEWAFFDHLHKLGRRTADNWLTKHGNDLGARTTFRPYYVFEESLRPAHLRGGTRRPREVDPAK